MPINGQVSNARLFERLSVCSRGEQGLGFAVALVCSCTTSFQVP